MQKDYWNKRWAQFNTGWDLGKASPPLAAYIKQLLHKNIRILIPGCGNAYEATFLLSLGFSNITLVDIAPELVKKVSRELSDTPVKIVCADFFELAGSFDLILEQTFFCAILPSQRTDYARKMHQLLNPGGRLVGVLFNRVFEQEGPPFGGNQLEYLNYFTPFFSFHTWEPCYNSTPPRQDTEWFINLLKK
jgi:methyl halide transferase